MFADAYWIDACTRPRIRDFQLSEETANYHRFEVYGTGETRTLESREIQNERRDFPLERGGRRVQLQEESNIG